MVESLIAQFRILFIGFWHSNHFGYTHSIDLAESLEGDDVSRCTSRVPTELRIVTGGSTNLPHPGIPSQ